MSEDLVNNPYEPYQAPEKRKFEYRVYAYFRRNIGHAAGQTVIDAMADKIKSNPIMAGTFGKVETPGNRTTDVYPGWLKTYLVNNRFKYDKFNLSYYRLVDDEDAGELLMKKFDATVRPWAAQQGYKDMENVELRMTTPHKSLDQLGLDDY